MKKLIMSGLILATMGITIVGCKKEKVETVNNNNVSTKNIDYTLDQIPLLENKQDILQLMLNPNDKDEEKLNKYLYEIGLATKDLIKNEEFNQTIIGMAKKSDNQTAYLLDLRTEAPIFFKIINENLAKNSLSLERIAEDMTHIPLTGNPEYPATMEVEKYVPAIFIPNLNALDNNKQPLLSPNIETDCSQNSEIEDFIITWYFNKNGNQVEIILGENTSVKTTNPLFIIDHAIKKHQLSTIATTNENQPRADFEDNQDRAIKRFDSKQIRIKTGYRQESGWWNDSEYCIVAYRIENNPNGIGIHHWIYSGGWKEIDDIKVSEINSLLTRQTLHAPNWTPYSDNRVFWNTFERDWNRSLKDLGTPNYDGRQLWMGGNMRYNGDWYAWIPSTVNVHATPFAWFGWNTSINFSSWKADYYIHKIL